MGKDWAPYSLWCFSTGYWQLCWTILFSIRSLDLALFLVRAGYSGIIFIPATFYHFIIAFLDRHEHRPKVQGAYVIAALLCSSVWIDSLFVNGLYLRTWGYYPKAGPLHPVFLAFLLLLFCHAVYLLAQELLRAKEFSLRRNQAKWVAYALGAYGIASLDFLVNYGLDLYPIGFVFTLTCLCMVAYAITKHHLLDIALIVRKTIIYSVVIGLLTSVYLVVITLFARLFQGIAGLQTVFSPALVAALITLGFQPLRKRVQAWVDAKFFREYVDREQKLYELSREVITHTTPEAMANSLIRVLRDTLHPKSAALYLRSQGGTGFFKISEPSGTALPATMAENNPISDYFVDHPQPFVQGFPAEIGEPLDTRGPHRNEDAA